MKHLIKLNYLPLCIKQFIYTYLPDSHQLKDAWLPLEKIIMSLLETAYFTSERSTYEHIVVK